MKRLLPLCIVLYVAYNGWNEMSLAAGDTGCWRNLVYFWQANLDIRPYMAYGLASAVFEIGRGPFQWQLSEIWWCNAQTVLCTGGALIALILYPRPATAMLVLSPFYLACVSGYRELYGWAAPFYLVLVAGVLDKPKFWHCYLLGVCGALYFGAWGLILGLLLALTLAYGPKAAFATGISGVLTISVLFGNLTNWGSKIAKVFDVIRAQPTRPVSWHPHLSDLLFAAEKLVGPLPLLCLGIFLVVVSIRRFNLEGYLRSSRPAEAILLGCALFLWFQVPELGVTQDYDLYGLTFMALVGAGVSAVHCRRRTQDFLDPGSLLT